MIKITKITVVIFVSLILINYGCAESKVIIQASPEFNITKAFTQKITPGQQHKKPYVGFGFEVTGITNKFVIDSVFCSVGKSVNIKTDGKNILKLNLDNKLKYDKAIFYYTQNGRKYCYELTDIKTKEELILP